MRQPRELRPLGLTIAALTVAVACTSSSVANRPATRATNGPLLVSQRVPADAKHGPASRFALLDVRTRTVTAVTPNAKHPTDGVVSRDGRYLAYVAVTATRLKPRQFQLHGAVHIIDISGSGDQTVYRCRETCTDLAWSPDGMQLVADEDDGIVVIDLNGATHRVCGSICGGELAQPAWSPDSSKIVFTRAKTLGKSQAFGSRVYETSAIWFADADGSDLIQLTDRSCSLTNPTDCTLDTDPSWSPDGTQIAFTRSTEVARVVGQHGPVGLAQEGQITVIRTDGTATRTIPCGAASCTSSKPSWSPDGSHLAFIDGATQVGDPGRVIVVAMPQGSRVTMPTPRHTKNTYFAAIAWAPDSTQLAMLLSHGYHSRVLTGRTNGTDLNEVAVPNVRGWDDATFAWAAKP